MNTVESLIDAVETAAAVAAGTGTPWRLPEEVLDWHGYGTRPMTTFLNTLCASVPDCRYVEFGSFAGRSLLAAAFGNAGTFVGVDNHSWLGQGAKKFPTRKALLEKLAAAVELASGNGNSVVVRSLDTAALGRTTFAADHPRCDVFMYDGDHAAGPTRDGIVTMARALRPGVLIMDDFRSSKWKEVPAGTVAGLADSGLTIHRHWALPYHTGVGVWVVS